MTESRQPAESADRYAEDIWDEAAIIERARRDPAAFAPLYREYIGPVYRYCYRQLGTKELAEDATSTIFTRALHGMESFENRSFRSWLFTIAYRVIVDVYRARRPDTALDNAADPSDPAPTPEETVLAKDNGRRIRALLGSLTDDQRQVIELRLAGLTGAEIAETLEKSVGAVRLQQHRAILRLRNLLNIDPETGGRR